MIMFGSLKFLDTGGVVGFGVIFVAFCGFKIFSSFSETKIR